MSKQQVIVVTGSSSGFGRKTAERFADAGWQVFATMRDSGGRHAEEAEALAARGMRVVELDVTDQASADHATAEILGEVEGVDVLVNNAGTSYFGPTEAFTVEVVKAQFDVNVFGPLRINRSLLPSMRERRSGLIVYISSLTGRLSLPGLGVYCASKFAIEAFAEAASYELGPLGIDVAIVEPGAFTTNISNSRVGPDDAQRVTGYAHLRATSAAIGAFLSESAKGRDLDEVAEAIYRLATSPPGSRPLRTPVPADTIVEGINTASALAHQQLLAALGAPATAELTT
ncbi:MAG TPA: SDR family oxidoreductase [Candidatus Cybelea sp.]|jgi:NAD(P)-dependent dehydrogenase (short-subunit alcohol dehydrogenase family)